MRFVLAAYGSRGDVEPCAVVGRELRRRGHDVSIAVPPNMVAFAEAVGLDVMAYGPDSHAQLNTAADFFVGNMKNLYAALPEVVERVTKVWVDKGTALASLAEDADLLVTGMNEPPQTHFGKHYLKYSVWSATSNWWCVQTPANTTMNP